MRRLLVTILFCCVPLAAVCADRDRLISECLTVDACLQRLDPWVPEHGVGASGDEERIATILKLRFGRSARDALLQAAVGDHGGWRNFAGALLLHWHDWDEDDVPLLGRALSLNPGGWIARPLGEIGTLAAIEVLVDDLAMSGSHTQTTFALKRIGPGVLPYLLRVLKLPRDQTRRGSWRDAAMLIETFGADAAVIADDWTNIAVEARYPRSQRIAALRGLAAIGQNAAAHWGTLRPLLGDADDEIAAQAFDTLVAMHDPGIAADYAVRCEPGGSYLDPFASLRFLECLRTLAEFGQNGAAAVPHLLHMLGETSIGAENAYIIETLGLVQDRSAGEAVAAFLTSRDWRLVYASVRSVGQLGTVSALDSIREIESSHWLPELRELAHAVGDSLATGAPFGEPDHMTRFTNRRVFGLYQLSRPNTIDCASGTWEWDNRQFSFREGRRGRSRMRLPDGLLIGTNRGEFGGSLMWNPDQGDSEILVEDNVITLLEAGHSVIAVFGLAHLGMSRGYALKLDRNVDADWTIQKVAHFPAAAYEIVELGQDEFAANADGRVVVFSSEGIEGLAVCARSQ